MLLIITLLGEPLGWGGRYLGLYRMQVEKEIEF